MKKVFIDTLTNVSNFDGSSGYRVVDVVESGSEFPIASPYFWHEHTEDISGNQHLYYYDTTDETVKLKPVREEVNIDALLDELLLTEPKAPTP